MNRLLSTLALAAVAIAATSCSDSATGPAASTARQLSPFAAAFDNLPQGQGQQITSDFRLTANGGTYTILNGRYKLTFPADAVCEPSASTYGPTEWDQPCITLQQGRTIMVHAVLMTNGGMGVDFTPALRFSPSAVVTIGTDQLANWLKQNQAYYLAHPAQLNYLSIYAVPGADGPTLDFAADLSLITHVDFSTGTVWRRIKHFSGYFMSSGQPCTPSPDVPDCVYVDGI